MVREKKTMPAPVGAKERHRRNIREIDRSAPLPAGLVARKEVPKSKHQTYYELVDNDAFKRKPLDFERTVQREPPSLFTFVPLGNPELTTKCKEVSREQGAMVYIVSSPVGANTDLAHQMNRVGYHFRSQIVQDAMQSLGLVEMHRPALSSSGVELIPRTQQEINDQADAALQELFPRIPHTDRGEIIDHAFRKGKASKDGEAVVGLQSGLSLSRRVQLAVLAHIRHNHTRYDSLLKETSWANARRATEDVCLDYLVKWRGDDENGRDQVDEIIREVVVLSDDESGDDDSEQDADAESSDDVIVAVERTALPGHNLLQDGTSRPLPRLQPETERRKKQIGSKQSKKALKRERKKARRGARGLKRYEAAWEEAVRRNRAAPEPEAHSNPSPVPGVYGSVSREIHPQNNSAQASWTYVDPPTKRLSANFSRDVSPLRDIPDHGYAQAFPFSNAVPPSLLPPRSEDDMHGNVNSTGYGLASQGAASLEARRLSAYHPAQPLLQDMIHPSIEPLSPGTAHMSAGTQGRWPAEPVSWPVMRPHQAPDPPVESFMVHDHPHQPPQNSNAYAFGGYSVRRGRQTSHAQMEPSEPMLSRPRHGQSPPGLRTTVIPQHAERMDGWPRHGTHVHNSHVTTGSALLESRPPQAFREEALLSSGQSVRDRFSPDCQIIEVRRPVHRAHAYYDDRRVEPIPEGFVRIREPVVPEPVHDIPQEGFIRLREPPFSHRDHMPLQTSYTRQGPLPGHHVSSERPLRDELRPSNFREPKQYYASRGVRPEDASFGSNPVVVRPVPGPPPAMAPNEYRDSSSYSRAHDQYAPHPYDHDDHGRTLRHAPYGHPNERNFFVLDE